MLLKAPFTIPDGFLRSFGYPGPRRFVAIYWSPMGDEACFDDGQSSACGLSDNWLYLGFMRRKDVWAWRTEHELDFGSSDEDATHWLLVDASTGEVYAAPFADARRIVQQQALPSREE